MDYLVILVLLTGSIGLMLFLFGAIFTGIVALGNNHKITACFIFLFMPLSLFYCAKNWDIAHYSGRMVYSGVILLSITAGILLFVGII